jgi:DNA polymerase III delta prime subunit
MQALNSCAEIVRARLGGQSLAVSAWCAVLGGWGYDPVYSVRAPARSSRVREAGAGLCVWAERGEREQRGRATRKNLAAHGTILGVLPSTFLLELKVAESAPAPQFDEKKIRAQLKKWQERLLDLTKGNPLLALNRSRVSKLFVTNPTAKELFNDVVIHESEIRLPMATQESHRLSEQEEPEPRDGYRIEPGDLDFDAAPLELLRKLRRIHDNARTSVEERGVTTLHLTFGCLEWRDDWLGEVTSPIWMVPAQLISKGPSAALRLAVAEEEMQLNPALELYLRERHKVALPELPEDTTEASLGHYLESVQRRVSDHRWLVTSNVWLSTFSFESLAIYNDLKAMADIAITHPVVAALARATVIDAGSDVICEGLDDLPSPGTVPIPVLPADSSQLEALTCGMAGAHLVIHGPPGTGKSQTISNLIADSLGKNKKVLFVSSKMAALNVVHQRLADKGLTRFCLEAHSTKAGKAKIVDELRRTLEVDDPSTSGRVEEALTSLARVRAELNRYIRELHQVRQPLGKTLYQAIGTLARLDAAPRIQATLPWSDILATSRSDLSEQLDMLSMLGAQAGVFDCRTTHPWRGFSRTAITLAEREQLEDDLRMILAGAKRLHELIPGIGAVVKTDDLSTSELSYLLPPLRTVTKLDRLPHQWFESTPEQLGSKAGLFERAAELQSEFEGQLAVYEKYFVLPLHDAATLLRPCIEQFAKLHRRILPPYWKWRSTLRERAVTEVKISYSAAVHLHGTVCRLIEIEEWFYAQAGELAAELEASQLRSEQALTVAADRCRVRKRPNRSLEQQLWAVELRRRLAAFERVDNSGEVADNARDQHAFTRA